jgi:hypothetical protein
MADQLQLYIHRDGQTPELRRLREIADKVKEELWEIDDIGTDVGRDLTPTRMEFIDYRREHIKKERT